MKRNSLQSMIVVMIIGLIFNACASSVDVMPVPINTIKEKKNAVCLDCYKTKYKKVLVKLILDYKALTIEVNELKKKVIYQNGRILNLEKKKIIELKSKRKLIKLKKDIKVAFVNTWSLYLREMPSSNSPSYRSYNVGRRVEIKSVINDWVELSNGSYVKSEWISAYHKKSLIVIKKVSLRSKPFVEENTWSENSSAGTKLQSVASVLNNEWYLLEDGTFISSRFVIENNKDK